MEMGSSHLSPSLLMWLAPVPPGGDSGPSWARMWQPLTPGAADWPVNGQDGRGGHVLHGPQNALGEGPVWPDQGLIEQGPYTS